MTAALFELEPAPLVGDIRFTVHGLPKTAGSKKFLGLIKHGQRAGRPIITDDTDQEGRAWRSAVQHAAREVWDSAPLRGPIRLRVDFTLPRPEGHFGSGAKSDRLRPSAPRWHTTRPDCTKLFRAVEDALNGVVWKDDSQVVAQRIGKRYGDRPGAEVVIEMLGEGI